MLMKIELYNSIYLIDETNKLIIMKDIVHSIAELSSQFLVTIVAVFLRKINLFGLKSTEPDETENTK